MPKPQPVVLSPKVVAYLLQEQLIASDPDNYRAIWFDQILTFSTAQRDCWRVLWENLLRGNLPLPHARIIGAWSGDTTHLSYLYKRHQAWKRIIVGNGNGMFWLQIPEHVLRNADHGQPA